MRPLAELRSIPRTDLRLGAGTRAYHCAHAIRRSTTHQHSCTSSRDRRSWWLPGPTGCAVNCSSDLWSGRRTAPVPRVSRCIPPRLPGQMSRRVKPAADVSRIDEMLADDVPRTVDLYEPDGCEPGHMHFMVYSLDEPIALSEALPVLEDMGVDVYTEHPYELKLPSGQSFWIQDFHLRHRKRRAARFEDVSRIASKSVSWRSSRRRRE